MKVQVKCPSEVPAPLLRVARNFFPEVLYTAISSPLLQVTLPLGATETLDAGAGTYAVSSSVRACSSACTCSCTGSVLHAASAREAMEINSMVAGCCIKRVV